METKRTKTAKLIVTDPLQGTMTSAGVDVTYRKKVLYSFTGKRAYIGDMLQMANKWAINQGFDKTKAEYR